MIDLMKRVRRGIPMVVVTMVMVLLTAPGWTADGDGLKSLGYASHGKTLQCSVLDGDMQLKILSPLAYQWDDERYCVLYVMDSRSDEQVAAAVAAFDNQRDDILPILIVRLPETLADAGTLADCLSRTVFPAIEADYRVVAYRILAGNRVDARMALTLGATYPDYFHSILAEAESTEAIPDDQLASLIKGLTAQTTSPRTICAATKAGAPDLPAFQEIANALKLRPGTTVRFVVQNSDIPADQKEGGLLLYKGLIGTFSDWYVKQEIGELGLEGVQTHYDRLGDLMGVELPVPQELVNRLARALLDNSDYVKLLEVLKFNASKHPASAKAHAALGQGWEVNNRVRTSIIHYKKAVAAAKKYDHPSHDLYRALLDAANQRLITGNISNKRLIQKSSSNKLTFAPQSYAVF